MILEIQNMEHRCKKRGQKLLNMERDPWTATCRHWHLVDVEYALSIIGKEGISVSQKNQVGLIDYPFGENVILYFQWDMKKDMTFHSV
jgi:hypothetical protein